MVLRKFFLVSAMSMVAATAAQAGGGDLLVAPTRVVLEGARGTEVILDNIGDAPATYRISLELYRMNANGKLDEVKPEAANDVEKKALEMITYAPRRVVLAPNLPQAIRIGVRPPANLPDGEYRAHMLFRAVPDAKAPTVQQTGPTGITIAITPIYGVTIPIIVRRGSLKATAAMSDVRLNKIPNGAELTLALSRSGNRSTYGTIRVMKPGKAEPVYFLKGFGIYPEIGQRRVSMMIPADKVALLSGPATVQYVEEPEAGGKVIAEIKTVFP